MDQYENLMHRADCLECGYLEEQLALIEKEECVTNSSLLRLLVKVLTHIQAETIDEDEYLTIRGVCAFFGYKSPESVYCRIRPTSRYFDPDFPLPDELAVGGAVRWRKGDLIRWKMARKKRRYGPKRDA